MPPLSPRVRGVLYALVTACGLGAITTQAKLVYADGGDSLSLMLMRFLVATLVFGAILLTRRAHFRVAPRMAPLLMTFWINAAGLLLILPLAIGKLAWPAGGGGMLALAAATGFCVVAILSQFEALARLPAARRAFLLNFEPVVSSLLARLVLAEELSVAQWSSVILVVSMVLLSLRFKPNGA